MKSRIWLFLGLALAVLAVPHLYAQVADTTAAASNAGYSYGITEAARLLAGALGAWLFKKWNLASDKLNQMNDLVKGLIGTAAITAMGMIGTFIGVTVSQNTTDWGENFWHSVAVGIFGTLLVKLGIGTAKARVEAGVHAG